MGRAACRRYISHPRPGRPPAPAGAGAASLKTHRAASPPIPPATGQPARSSDPTAPTPPLRARCRIRSPPRLRLGRRLRRRARPRAHATLRAGQGSARCQTKRAIPASALQAATAGTGPTSARAGAAASARRLRGSSRPLTQRVRPPAKTGPPPQSSPSIMRSISRFSASDSGLPRVKAAMKAGSEPPKLSATTLRLRREK